MCHECRGLVPVGEHPLCVGAYSFCSAECFDAHDVRAFFNGVPLVLGGLTPLRGGSVLVSDDGHPDALPYAQETIAPDEHGEQTFYIPHEDRERSSLVVVRTRKPGFQSTSTFVDVGEPGAYLHVHAVADPIFPAFPGITSPTDKR